jgi:DNA-binding winged helix-turn-helix (wHTH) protein
MSHLYRFGQFALDSRRRTLSRADSPISLTPKAFDVLLFLAQNPNRLVTKEELLQAVWGDTFVEEGNLTQYISHVRKALGDNSLGDNPLGDNPKDTRLIVTIARKGYQFTGDVTVAYYALGRKKASDAALSKYIAKYASFTYGAAEVYAFRNQSDEAFEWLDRAYAQRNTGLIQTKVDPLLKSLHKDPRFAAFLKKLNLPN